MKHAETPSAIHPRVILIPLTAAAAIYTVLFLAVALQRMNYPFELEWMEGAIVDHVARVITGQGIYVRPSLEFVPFIYTPLYYYFSAGVAQVLDLGFLPLRVVSFVATLLCLVLIYRIVLRETRSRLLSMIGAGLYAASYAAVGGWFDIARSDALLVLLILVTIYIFRYHRNRIGQLAVAGLLVLAFLTKQSALIFAGAILLLYVYELRLKAWPAIAAFGLLLSASILLGQTLTGGWFTYYVFFLPGSHQFLPGQLYQFWLSDIARYLWPSVILTLWYLVSLMKNRRLTDAVFWLITGAGMVGMAWSGRLHSGGYVNVLMPAFAFFALAAPVALKSLLEKQSDLVLRLRPFLLLLGLVQFALFIYSPSSLIPSDMDRLTGHKIVDSIKGTQGNVLVPYHGWLTKMAGKSVHAHKMAIGDVVRADSLEGGRLEAEIHAAIRDQQFDLIIIDAAWQMDALGGYYRSIGNVTGETKYFYPVSGFPTRPKHWLVPK